MYDFVLYRLPTRQGWAFLSAAVENDGWLQFAGVGRDSKGYIAQEIAKLMKQAEHLYKPTK